MKHLLAALLFLALTTTIHAKQSPLEEGFALLDQHKYRAAFLRFSSIKPKNRHVYAGMGMAKYFGREYDRASQYLSRSLRFKSAAPNWSVHYFAGLSLYDAGEYRQAVPHLVRASELKNIAEVNYHAGSALAHLKEYIKAETYLLSAIEQNPAFLQAYLELLTVYENRKLYDSARKLLVIARNKMGDNPHLAYQQARLYFAQGQTELAEKELNRATKDLPPQKVQGLYSSIRKSRPGAPKSVSKQIEAAAADTRSGGMMYLLLACVSIAAVLTFFVLRTRNSATPSRQTEETPPDASVTPDDPAATAHRNILDDNITMSQIRVACIMGDYDRAWKLSEKIFEHKIRLFVQGLILLFLRDMPKFESHLEFLQKEGLEHDAQTLRKLSPEDKSLLLRALLDLSQLHR